MVTDLYAVLGVPRGATAEELKAAYRRGVLASHPDRHRLSPPAERARAEARFRALTEAYETLTDARARSSYDRAGPGGAAAGFRPRHPGAGRASTARAPFGYEAIFHRWRQQRARGRGVLPAGGALLLGGLATLTAFGTVAFVGTRTQTPAKSFEDVAAELAEANRRSGRRFNSGRVRGGASGLRLGIEERNAQIKEAVRRRQQ